MLATMSPIFSLDFSSPHRPTVSSPLSSSPIRASSQATSPPLSPTCGNRQAPPVFASSSSASSSPVAPPQFKYASRPAKPNPLRQSRESATAGRRKLFLKNVRQRQDDRQWERRGGDQEVLKLEWALLDKRRKQQKASDADAATVVFEDDIDDEFDNLHQAAGAHGPVGADDMMLDALEREEDAMLSLYEAQASSQQQQQQQQQATPRPPSPSFDDDEYDSLFIDLLSPSDYENHNVHMSNEMDLS